MLPGGPAALAEPLRAIATQFLIEHHGRGRRGVAVCGASRGVGVSFVAANLAIAMAETGIPTLLVDANLRWPSLHELFDRKRIVGLNEVLTDEHLHPADAIQRDITPALDALFAGEPIEAAQDALSGVRGQAIFGDLLRSHEFVIVDTPAAGLSEIPLTVATSMGYALVVARRDDSFVADVRTLISELETNGVWILGVILNGA
jgi:protein-tyrosine kinase